MAKEREESLEELTRKGQTIVEVVPTLRNEYQKIQHGAGNKSIEALAGLMCDALKAEIENSPSITAAQIYAIIMMINTPDYNPLTNPPTPSPSAEELRTALANISVALEELEQVAARSSIEGVAIVQQLEEARSTLSLAEENLKAQEELKQYQQYLATGRALAMAAVNSSTFFRPTHQRLAGDKITLLALEQALKEARTSALQTLKKVLIGDAPSCSSSTITHSSSSSSLSPQDSPPNSPPSLRLS